LRGILAKPEIDIRPLSRTHKGVNVAKLGNTIYAAIADNAAAIAQIRTELGSLALQIATDPNASARVTSATINGQTFTAQPTMTNLERLSLLRWVVKCCDNKGPISTVQITTF
jgi:hypothetical protein